MPITLLVIAFSILSIMTGLYFYPNKTSFSQIMLYIDLEYLKTISFYIIQQLGKLTVAILKDIIKKERINTAATRKNDIIDAINNHFGVWLVAIQRL